MLRLLTLCTVGIATPSYATCVQFSNDVNGAIDYLVCLHNEQNRVLNEFSDIVNNHARKLDSVSSAVLTIDDNSAEMARRISRLEGEVADLQRELTELRP